MVLNSGLGGHAAAGERIGVGEREATVITVVSAAMIRLFQIEWRSAGVWKYPA